FAGCDALAAAIVAGDAPTNQCPVGGSGVAEKVSKVMGAEPSSSTKRVAVVSCNGAKGSCLKKYEYYGATDCQQASAILGGDKACEFGCLGFGSCVKACSFGALSVNSEGVAVVNPELCTSCGKCAKACPKGIIRIVPYDKQVEVLCNSKDRGKTVKDKCKVGCIACGICKKNCPSDAIEIEGNLPKIDSEKCTSCGTCVQKCPQKAIYRLKAS
ncbi:MAG: RnfABCDGE type electron transport complex subunit B, partial [Eubacteriaceae bacterium]|nr:RnfABCDGE type electron transport complex subunit B [Eubacteriaceae bacterium]